MSQGEKEGKKCTSQSKPQEGVSLHLAAVSRTTYIDYLQREVAHGSQWHGKGAELLEIDGEKVTRENFILLARGIDPVHGEVLRGRERYDLTRNGEIIGRSRALYDCDLAPGKSVSIMSMFDERIDKAHRETVSELAPRMEALAATRVRKGYAEENRITGNLIYTPIHHTLSRSLDPQIHTHLIVMNLTHDPVENEWKALQAYPIFKHRFPLHETYRELLAERVTGLGYEIRERTDRNGGWEMEGVSERLMVEYSQRSRQISEAKKEYLQLYGVDPDARSIAGLARNHRPDKVYPPTEEVRERQMERLTPVERESLVTLKERAIERCVPVEYETWHPNPYNREPEPKERDEPEQERQKPHSWNLEDHVEHEAPAEYHRPWSYGEKPKQRAY
jgi:conjugative relaxase-like TrwC/TraI family protein